MAVADTLNVNAYLKFIEFILNSVDNSEDGTTIREIRNQFREKFGIENYKFLNQHFGILRLVPLMCIVEEEFLNGTEDWEKMKAVRNSFAHNTFSCNEDGYCFDPQPNWPDAERVLITYADFVPFLHRVETAFYNSETYRATRNGV